MLLISTTLSYVRARFGELQAREEGVTAVEYALMVAVVALLLVVGFFFLFRNVSSKFSSAGSCVKAAASSCP
jgi:Flp pilus assembly pilin Flp